MSVVFAALQPIVERVLLTPHKKGPAACPLFSLSRVSLPHIQQTTKHHIGPLLPSGDQFVEVLISPQEHEAVTKLYERYDRTSLLIQNLNGCFRLLDICAQRCKDEVENRIDYMLDGLRAKQKELHENMNGVKADKTEKLEDQVRSLQDYLRDLEEVESSAFLFAFLFWE